MTQHPIPNDEQSIRQDSDSVSSMEEFMIRYLPENYKKELMKKAADGDKEAIKKLAELWANEIFEKIDAELRSGKQEAPEKQADLCPYCKKPMDWNQWKENWACREHGQFDKGVSV